ncbi:unnamed protein product [Pelagomonas calceolata]|uniref:Glutaredoxin domain-containing protein n=1 Tax=Pelagomonas calceolata TaxID=35677 RepID=A0A8J2WIV4_9STRA|nr:unnamed protein product [Pelagomonas calceolata]
MALLRGLRAAAARLPRRPPPSTRRRALTSTKERSKASREDDQRLYHRAKLAGALNDEPTKNPMIDAVLGAAVALFFGGGIYALFLRSSGRLSVPADPTDRQFFENPSAGGGHPRGAAASLYIYTPVAEIIEAAPVVVFSAPDCPYCDEAKAALRDAGVAFTEVAASDWQRVQLTKRTGSRTVPQVFAGGEFVGGCHDGGLGGTVPLLRMGLLQEMAARAAGERDREKQAVERQLARRDGRLHVVGVEPADAVVVGRVHPAHAAAGDELARLRRQLAAEKKD